MKLRRKKLFESLTVRFFKAGVDLDFIIFIHCEAILRKREKGANHDLNFCDQINLSITCRIKVLRTVDHAKALFDTGGKEMPHQQGEMYAHWLKEDFLQ